MTEKLVTHDYTFSLKQLGRYASLNTNIYIIADPTPVDIGHAAHACHCIVRPRSLLSKIMTTQLLLIFVYNLFKFSDTLIF